MKYTCSTCGKKTDGKTASDGERFSFVIYKPGKLNPPIKTGS